MEKKHNFVNCPGNRSPWNKWSYGGVALEEREESGIEDAAWEGLEEISERGKKRKGQLIIENRRGGVTYVYNTRKIDVPDAVKMKVLRSKIKIRNTHSRIHPC